HDELFGWRRPNLLLDGERTDAGPLVQALIRPEVQHLVERAELSVPDAGQRRELAARLHHRRPDLFELADRAGLERVGAQLVYHRRSSEGTGNREEAVAPDGLKAARIIARYDQ